MCPGVPGRQPAHARRRAPVRPRERAADPGLHAAVSSPPRGAPRGAAGRTPGRAPARAGGVGGAPRARARGAGARAGAAAAARCEAAARPGQGRGRRSRGGRPAALLCRLPEEAGAADDVRHVHPVLPWRAARRRPPWRDMRDARAGPQAARRVRARRACRAAGGTTCEGAARMQGAARAGFLRCLPPLLFVWKRDLRCRDVYPCIHACICMQRCTSMQHALLRFAFGQIAHPSDGTNSAKALPTCECQYSDTSSGAQCNSGLSHAQCNRGLSDAQCNTDLL
eukprot:366288-Chlamydomonas_euryale.AAC.3